MAGGAILLFKDIRGRYVFLFFSLLCVWSARAIRDGMRGKKISNRAVVLTVVFNRPKTYCVKVEDSNSGKTMDLKRAKGVTRAAIKNVSFKDFLDTWCIVHTRESLMLQMNRLLSSRHHMFMITCNKRSLSVGCKKRSFKKAVNRYRGDIGLFLWVTQWVV